MPAVSLHAEDNSTRMERNLIVEGNKLYHDKKYADAEVAYRKALEIDAMNEIAQFNLAASLLRQGTSTGENEKQASQILGKLASDAEKVMDESCVKRNSCIMMVFCMTHSAFTGSSRNSTGATRANSGHP